MPDYSEEKAFIAQGYKIVCGTDEAGRGPLAGPVYAAAVILRTDEIIEGLDDSKKLTAKKRERLYDIIKEMALSYAVARAEVEEIDSINILNASQLAMRRAINLLTVPPDAVLVDGNVARGFTLPVKTVIKGDSKSMSIAAASILAKVERDRYCLEMDRLYPEYHFAGHKGYATKEHMDILRRIGPCPEHRRTFLGFLQK